MSFDKTTATEISESLNSCHSDNISGGSKLKLHLLSSPDLIWSDLIWSDLIWSDLIWSDLIWSDLIWSDLIWSDLTWPDLIWSDLIWSDLIWSDLIWSDLIWSDLIWSDLIWSDLIWSDLIRSDLIWSNLIWRIFSILIIIWFGWNMITFSYPIPNSNFRSIRLVIHLFEIVMHRWGHWCLWTFYFRKTSLLSDLSTLAYLSPSFNPW